MIISLFEQHSPSISQLSQTQKKISQKIKGSYQTWTVIADILGFTSFFLPATDLILAYCVASVIVLPSALCPSVAMNELVTCLFISQFLWRFCSGEQAH